MGSKDYLELCLGLLPIQTLVVDRFMCVYVMSDENEGDCGSVYAACCDERIKG